MGRFISKSCRALFAGERSNAKGRRFVLSAFVGLLLGPSVLAATGRSESCGGSCAVSNVSLAVIVPKGGQPPAVRFGAQVWKPVELAVRDLNAAGGVLGRQINLDVIDDECEPALALRAANHHVDHNRPSGVIGPICPAAAATAASIYGRAGLLQILPTVPMARVDTARLHASNIFSMIPKDQQEASALAEHLVREHKGKTLTVVYSDTFFRREIASAVRLALPVEMQKSVQFQPLHDISGLYDRVADQLQQQKPDVIYLALDHAPLLQLLGKLRQRSLKAHLVGGHHLLSYGFWFDAQRLSEGIHVVAPIGTPTNPDFRTVVDRLAEAGSIPDLLALNSYATVQIWAEAVRRSGSAETGKVADILRQHEFQTAVGPVAFDQHGNRRSLRYSFLTWREGRPRFVAQSP